MTERELLQLIVDHVPRVPLTAGFWEALWWRYFTVSDVGVNHASDVYWDNLDSINFPVTEHQKLLQEFPKPPEEIFDGPGGTTTPDAINWLIIDLAQWLRRLEEM